MASFFGWMREPKPTLDRRTSLQGVPVRHETITVDPTAGGTNGIVLINRFERGKGFLSRFAPPVIEQRLELDELGAFVFQLIDGERTVAQIIEEFVRRYRVNRREAELCTVAFLRRLTQKRLVSIVIR